MSFIRNWRHVRRAVHAILFIHICFYDMYEVVRSFFIHLRGRYTFYTYFTGNYVWFGSLGLFFGKHLVAKELKLMAWMQFKIGFCFVWRLCLSGIYLFYIINYVLVLRTRSLGWIYVALYDTVISSYLTVNLDPSNNL